MSSLLLGDQTAGQVSGLNLTALERSEFTVTMRGAEQSSQMPPPKKVKKIVPEYTGPIHVEFSGDEDGSDSSYRPPSQGGQPE